MSIPGRKPKPLSLHVINGNPSKLNLEEKIASQPKPKPIAPKCPEWLKKDKAAYQEWKRVAPELERLGLLTSVDGAALEGYCKAYSRWLEAEQFMDKEIEDKKGEKKAIGTYYRIQSKTGSSYYQQLPQVAIAQKYLQIAKAFMAEFGLTPSSRGRMQLPSEQNEDDMERYLD
jgi:P27 family predicted phage terminase small subunit